MNEIWVSKIRYNVLLFGKKIGDWNLLMCVRIVLGEEFVLYILGWEVIGLE